MWRSVEKKELYYMRHMEERAWKQKMLCGLSLTVILLLLILLLTYNGKLKDEDRLSNSYSIEAFTSLTAIVFGTEKPDDKPKESLKEARHRLNTTYYWVFGLECLAAAGVFGYYAYSDRRKINEILNGPLLAQSAVCIGKREYHSRSAVSVYLNIRTQSNETLRDIRVPWIIGSKLECDMPVLAVMYTRTGEDGKEETHYKLYPERGGRKQNVESGQ